VQRVGGRENPTRTGDRGEDRQAAGIELHPWASSGFVTTGYSFATTIRKTN
jgi:hypothetical protein